MFFSALYSHELISLHGIYTFIRRVKLHSYSLNKQLKVKILKSKNMPLVTPCGNMEPEYNIFL